MSDRIIIQTDGQNRKKLFKKLSTWIFGLIFY